MPNWPQAFQPYPWSGGINNKKKPSLFLSFNKPNVTSTYVQNAGTRRRKITFIYSTLHCFLFRSSIIYLLIYEGQYHNLPLYPKFITALEVFNIYTDVRVSIIIILYSIPDPLLLPQTTPPQKNQLQHFTFLLFYISHALHYISTET